MNVTQAMKDVTLQSNRELFIKINILKLVTNNYEVNKGILSSKLDNMSYEDGIITIQGAEINNGILELSGGFQIDRVVIGHALEGSVNIDVNSDLRSNVSLNMVVTGGSFDLSTDNNDWFNRYIQLYIGIKNNKTKDIEWFNKGIFVINNPSWQYDLTTNQLTIEGTDLVALLNGDLNGQMENITTIIPAGSNIKDSITSTLQQFTQFVDYNISDAIIGYDEFNQPVIQNVPNELTFEQGATVWDIIVGLRDIIPNYECYFDENGVFCYQPTPLISYGLIKRNIYKMDVSLTDNNLLVLINKDFPATLYNQVAQCVVTPNTTLQSGDESALWITVFNTTFTVSAPENIINWGTADATIIPAYEKDFTELPLYEITNSDYQPVFILEANISYTIEFRYQKFAGSLSAFPFYYGVIIDKTPISNMFDNNTLLETYINQDIFNKTVLSEATNTNFNEIKNRVEVFGRTHEPTHTASGVVVNTLDPKNIPQPIYEATVSVDGSRIALDVPDIPAYNTDNKYSIRFTPTVDIEENPVFIISQWDEMSFSESGNYGVIIVPYGASLYKQSNTLKANETYIIQVEFYRLPSGSGFGNLPRWYGLLLSGGEVYNPPYNSIDLSVPSLYDAIQIDGLKNSLPTTISFTLADNAFSLNGLQVTILDAVNKTSGEALPTMLLKDDSDNIITQLTHDEQYVINIIYDEIHNMYKCVYLGHIQAYGIAENNDINNPYSIPNNGVIRISLSGGEYDNITSDNLAQQRAEWELYKSSKLTNNTQLTCVPIYYADVNKLVTYNSNILKNTTNQWIIQSVITDLSATGTQTINMTQYYPFVKEI